MSTGPCLCGDPYCPSCGDPEAALFADAIDEVFNDLCNFITTEEDLILFKSFAEAFKSFKAAREEYLKQLKETYDYEKAVYGSDNR